MVASLEESKYDFCVTFLDQFTISHTSNRAGRKEVTDFTMTRVFGPDSQQTEVFSDTKRLVQSAVDGFNVCIFAYGQTGSGKTYAFHICTFSVKLSAYLTCRFTMIGDPSREEAWGIAPRSVQEIFNLRQLAGVNKDFELQCYMVELYRDKFYDLLCDKSDYGKEKIDPFKDPAENNLIMLRNATVLTVSTFEELFGHLMRGMSNRRTGSTSTFRRHFRVFLSAGGDICNLQR